MSNEERARILRMVSEGTISPSEAEELLSAMESGPRSAERPAAPAPPALPAPPAFPTRRSLVIQVNEGGDSKVNLRIPLGLARAAGRFLPRNARKSLEGYDIDLEELLEGLSSGEVGGTLLEVNDDEDQVRISVE